MATRKGKFGQFWGCTRYPICCGIRSTDGTAKSPGAPPTRKDAAAREAFNREASKRIAEAASVHDDQPCPFDDMPGPHDTRTAFGFNGQLNAVEFEPDNATLDQEYAAMFRD